MSLPTEGLALCDTTDKNQTLVYGDANTSLSFSIALAGDANGDGFSDVIVGSPGFPRQAGDAVPGNAYVIFHPADQDEVVLGEHVGLTIVGESPNHFAGTEVEGVGDVNGDGLADMLVDAGQLCKPVNPDCVHDCEIFCGPGPDRAYLVHGRTEAGDINLIEVASGVGGFAIETGEMSLRNFVPLGDISGDGLSDFAILSTSRWQGGLVVIAVIFGKKDTEAVILSDLAQAAGFLILDSNGRGAQINGGGDVNGDGFRDLLISVPDEDSGNGRAYVVFVKQSLGSITLSDLAAGDGSGFAIGNPDLEPDSEKEGTGAFPAGDINGDGLADVLISALGLPEGQAQIVLGKADSKPIVLNSTPEERVAIQSSGGGRILFFSNGQDLDGDNSPDILASEWTTNKYAWIHHVMPGDSVVLGDSLSPWIDLQIGWSLWKIIDDADCDGRPDLVFLKSEITPALMLLDYEFSS